jgi:hypothetical protein
MAVKDMWRFGSKKSKAVTNWHSKAMLIDPKKTRITIIKTGVFEDFEVEDAPSIQICQLNPLALFFNIEKRIR